MSTASVQIQSRHLRLVAERRRPSTPRDTTLARVRDARRRLERQRDRDDRFAYLRRSYD
jgi:hypothetical protein